MYTYTQKEYIVTESPYMPALLLHDYDADGTPLDADRHFRNIHALFVEMIDQLAADKHSLSAYEEQELRLMFEALVQAKQKQGARHT